MSHQLALPLAESSPTAERPETPETPGHQVTPAAQKRVVPRNVGPAERADLQHQLEQIHGAPLQSLTLTDNRVTIFSSSRQRSGGLAMRIHAGFAGAPIEILRDVIVCTTVAGRTARTKALRQESLQRVREFFDSLDLKPNTRRQASLVSCGAIYDLQKIFDRINSRYFSDGIVASVTWGQQRRARRRRRSYSIQLGSYVYEDQRIRLHPILDDRKVPAYVVDAVMHHEMVHAFLGLEGCESAHGPEFRALEREFAQLEQADKWLDCNLRKLIARAERRRSD